jgi:lipopolysaccharide heptosyltransferase I
MRILIVRPRSLGDVIHALPVACALKDCIPNAYVGWLAENWASEVLVGHPAIDERICVTGSWTRSLRQMRNVRRTLRALRFDVVLDLQGVCSTVLAAVLSGAPRRLGFVGMVSHQLRDLIRSDDGLRAASWAIARPLHFELVRASHQHIVDRYLEILAPLGMHDPQVRFGITESAEDARTIERLLHDSNLVAQRYAVINAGGPAFKRWPAKRFAAVARHLDSTHRLPTLVVHGLDEEERQAARETVTASGGTARLVPLLSVGQVAALGRRARLFVSGDTGLLHLAAAVGAPSVGLVGHALAERFRPYGAANIVVEGKRVPLHRARRGGLGVDAMRAIEVDAVCRACDAMLGRRV